MYLIIEYIIYNFLYYLGKSFSKLINYVVGVNVYYLFLKKTLFVIVDELNSGKWYVVLQPFLGMFFEVIFLLVIISIFNKKHSEQMLSLKEFVLKKKMIFPLLIFALLFARILLKASSENLRLFLQSLVFMLPVFVYDTIDEIYFRRVIYRITRKYFNVLVSLAITSIMFLIFNFSNPYIFSAVPKLHFISLFVLSFIYTALFELTNSILSSILVRTMNDFFIIQVLISVKNWTYLTVWNLMIIFYCVGLSVMRKSNKYSMILDSSDGGGKD